MEITKIAIYGLSTETEKELPGLKEQYHIIGLLDGFKTDGAIYGERIISFEKALADGVERIIVVARPGSCKVIAKKIGEACKERGIELFDIRGRDLLADSAVSYDFSGLAGESRSRLEEKIAAADVVSFDLFDTLVTRRVYSYTDIFDILDIKLKEQGIIIPDFARLRLHAEKELSKRTAPRLEEIYRLVLKKSGGNFISAKVLADMEWELDFVTIIPRCTVCDILKNTVSEGKKVVITTDSYYSTRQLRNVLDKFGLGGIDDILVSCEYGTSKAQNLYVTLKEKYKGNKILHIGDDEVADIEKSAIYGLDSCRIYSGADLYDCLGGLGLESEIKKISDRIKVGMFISSLFNSPFWFEDEGQRLSVNDASQIGYLFCAPMITDFVLWMKERTEEQNYKQLLFCARDGYLPGRLYREISKHTKSVYFLSSRTAAIRAGMENVKDIEYVDSMKYFGSSEEALRTRFGISADDIVKVEREKAILLKSGIQRDNYKKYIEKLELDDGTIGMFDFVAKGTTQMYLQKLFRQHIKGFYFLQLEPEFMADKGLDIEPFYSDDEKNSSAIFDNYYILETILTSPYSQVEEFNENGDPIFANETRSATDIKVFESAQMGITQYFEDYLSLVPQDARAVNKVLDEKLLALINRIQIMDGDFMNLKVEDPFFGRMTDIKDVIG